MEEKTIFSREENTEALFQKILSDPWSCERLQDTFSDDLSDEDIKDPLSPEKFAEMLLSSYNNRDLSALLMGICRSTVFDLMRNSSIIPYRLNADGKENPLIMTDENGILLPEHRKMVSDKKYKHFLEVYNDINETGIADDIYFARAYRYKHSYRENGTAVKQDVVDRAYGALLVRPFSDTLESKKSEAQAYADIWDIMSSLEKSIPGAFVFYGQGALIKDGKRYDEMAVLIPDHIFSKNLKRTVKKAKAILYGRE